ncbi:hypothetical protein JCM2811A_45580 [Methylorubrum rhodinum]
MDLPAAVEATGRRDGGRGDARADENGREAGKNGGTHGQTDAVSTEVVKVSKGAGAVPQLSLRCIVSLSV